MNIKEADEQFILENLSFTNSAMCSLEASRSRPWGGLEPPLGGFLLTTETNAASDNWAFLPSRTVDRAQIQEACSFFGDLPFVWPVFPGADPSYRRTLEDEGFFLYEKLVAMRRQPQARSENTDLTFTKITTGEGAALWADTAWQGFDFPPGAPVSFVNLMRGLCAKKDLLLMLAERNGLPVGTALVSFSALSAGVYYFSTLPAERKKGVGAATMEEIFRIARGGAPFGRDYVSLQATPSGVSFYTSLGFESLFGIPLYSRPLYTDLGRR